MSTEALTMITIIFIQTSLQAPHWQTKRVSLKFTFPWVPELLTPAPNPSRQEPSLSTRLFIYQWFYVQVGLGGWGARRCGVTSHTWDTNPEGQSLWGQVESCKGQPCGYARCRWGSSEWSSQWCSGPDSGEQCLEMG